MYETLFRLEFYFNPNKKVGALFVESEQTKIMEPVCYGTNESEFGLVLFLYEMNARLIIASNRIKHAWHVPL